MGISDILIVFDYERVIETLKAGPDFGIHGARYDNLSKLLKSPNSCIGHYFCVGREERKLPDDEFYERLWASVDIALGYSARIEIIDDRRVSFSSQPTLILIIDNRKQALDFILEGKFSRSSHIYYSSKGREASTFPIGEGVPVIPGVEIVPVVASDMEIASINRRLEDYCRGKTIAGDAAQTLVVKRCLTKGMIKRIYQEMRNHSK